MKDYYKLLIINPGSTSTKIAVFHNEEKIYEKNISHSESELEPFATIMSQYDFRLEVILKALKGEGISLEELDGVVGRGGLLKPLEGGTYAINEAILSDLRNGVAGEHASNLGALIAHGIASQRNIPAYIVDPVAVDEMEEIARISGLPEIQRVSLLHALNQKAVARKAAGEMNRKYEDVNFIVAHLGGGITVGAHRKGRIIDVNNALGDGPFSPERTGSLSSTSLANLCYSGQYTKEEMKRKLIGRGGLVGYLGTNDGRVVGKRIQEGDSFAELIYRAMAYQISKEIGSAATVLKGEVDAVILTGGLAHDTMLMEWISESVKFIARIIIYPGEKEMEALAGGALRVLRRQEKAKPYIKSGS